MKTRPLVEILCKTVLYLEETEEKSQRGIPLFYFFMEFSHLSLFYVFNFFYMPSSLADKQSPGPVVQHVTSDILVPEVMKLIWWSVSDMANKQSPYWSWSTGSTPLCSALFCIVKDRELLPQGTNAT